MARWASVPLSPFIDEEPQPDLVLSSAVFPPTSVFWKEMLVSLTFSITVVRRYRCEKLNCHHSGSVCSGIVMLFQHELFSGSYERNKGMDTAEGSRDIGRETQNQTTAKTRNGEGPA